ncbi:hypothetical protein TrLO_g12440 [Triparma laevis f. longispina]|uniref:PH domain-containing protein n=1 Tax=Triparma laevis f. longispina TaxID=1714387 RepID=A0A9W7AAS0_9STRA|nr:hypothetical protein TrLO_g12440 [Triparma laevis f. longispina]
MSALQAPRPPQLERKSSEVSEGFSLCETLYKRRNGLGKHADQNWVPRCFTFHTSILCYYDEEFFEDADPSRPRGRIDLARDETKASFVDVQKQGAPTKFLVVLQIFVLGGIERKWKMCANSKNQQQRWFEALKQYDGQPDVDVGQQILDALSIGNGGSQTPRNRAKTNAFNKTFRTLRKNSNAFTLGLNQGSQNDEEEQQHKKTPAMLFLAFNLTIIVARVGDNTFFWMSVVLVNMLLCKALKTSWRKEVKAVIEEEEDEPGLEDIPQNKTVPAAGTMPRAKPKQGSDLEEFLKAPNQGFLSATGCKELAKNLSCFEKLPHSYWNGDGTIFNVRMGPNYKRTGLKKPSKMSLYDLYAVDFVRTEERMKESRDVFQPPDIPGITDVPTGHSYIPPMMIITASMPVNEPSLFNSTDDGPSFNVVFYFVISDATRAALKDMASASPALKLFGEWCRRAENEPQFRGRFKCMCILDEIEKLGLPTPIPGYNGKPVLINKSGAFFRRKNYIEQTINVHLFAYIAKKALYSIQPKFPKMVLNVGFNIEGKEDDELPECMLGVGKLFHLDPGSAPDDLGLD